MCISVFSQSINISGVVSDDSKQTIPGVNVYEKGTTNGAISDIDGNFSIMISSDDATLVFSFIGYDDFEVIPKEQRVIDVELKSSSELLEEVVAVGYGTVLKRDLTGAVSSLKSDDLAKGNSNSFAEALQGKIAGVRVSTQSGEPGGAVNVEIRGANSIYGGSSPLYIIDGVAIDVNEGEVATSTVGGSTTANPLASISPEDIESLEVLKDASSTAIYGARGANGVIIITTKSGQNSDSKINVSASYGVSEIVNSYNMLGAQEYVDYRHASAVSNPTWGQDTDGDGVIDSPADASQMGSYNWQDELYRLGSVRKMNASLQGGDEKTKFALGVGYLNQEGLVINNDYDRFSARVKLDHNVTDKLKIGMSANWSKAVNTGVGSSGGGEGNWSGIVQAIYIYRPVLLYDETEEEEPVSLKSMMNDAYKTTTMNRLIGNAYINYKFTKSLNLRVSGGGTSTSSKLSEFYGSETLWGRNSNGRAKLRHIQTENVYQTSTLNYWKKINKYQVFKAMAGFEMSSYQYESIGTSALNFADQTTGIFDISKGLLAEIPSSSVTEVNRMSLFGRLNYNIKERYLFTATIRRDGSSNFGEGNKYGTFPSLAFAWRLKEESFMKDIERISNLKMRLSYGVTGNDRIPAYRSLASLSTTYYPSNGNVRFGLSPVAAANPDLKWETTSQVNAGLDLGLLRNRIVFTTDLYYKRTSDMLIEAQISSQGGFPTQWQNLGSIDNRGVELTLNTVNFDRRFKWSTNVNFYANRNKIVSLGGSESIPVTFGNGYLTDVGIVKEGEALGTGYGYVWDGIYQIDEFTWQNDSDPSIAHNDRDYVPKEGVAIISGEKVRPGLFKYKDIEGDDGIVDAYDRTIISNSNPKFSGALSNEFSYGAFSLNLFFEGVYGNTIINAFPNRVEAGSGAADYNLTEEYWHNRWTPENPSNRYADYSKDNSDGKSSTYYVEDGSYLRFKTVSLRYTCNKRFLQKIKVSNLSIYANIDNLYTWTNYSGLDPDVRSNNKLLPGYDRLAYPRARTYTLGLNITL